VQGLNMFLWIKDDLCARKKLSNMTHCLRGLESFSA
jgi:hypothetical protein